MSAARPKGLLALGDKYLTRADYASSRGYWARVCGQGGYLEPRWFSVAACGSWAGAKRAAKAHVLDVIARYRLTPAPPGSRAPRPRSRFKRTPPEHTIGVNLALHQNPGGLYYLAWNARWCERDAAGVVRPRNRSFSILRYGYAGAFRRALQMRRQRLGLRGPLASPPALDQVARQLRKRIGARWKTRIAAKWGDSSWQS